MKKRLICTTSAASKIVLAVILVMVLLFPTRLLANIPGGQMLAIDRAANSMAIIAANLVSTSLPACTDALASKIEVIDSMRDRSQRQAIIIAVLGTVLGCVVLFGGFIVWLEIRDRRRRKTIEVMPNVEPRHETQFDPQVAYVISLYVLESHRAQSDLATMMDAQAEEAVARRQAEEELAQVRAQLARAQGQRSESDARLASVRTTLQRLNGMYPFNAMNTLSSGSQPAIDLDGFARHLENHGKDLSSVLATWLECAFARAQIQWRLVAPEVASDPALVAKLTADLASAIVLEEGSLDALAPLLAALTKQSEKDVFLALAPMSAEEVHRFLEITAGVSLNDRLLRSPQDLCGSLSPPPVPTVCDSAVSDISDTIGPPPTRRATLTDLSGPLSFEAMPSTIPPPIPTPPPTLVGGMAMPTTAPPPPATPVTDETDFSALAEPSGGSPPDQSVVRSVPTATQRPGAPKLSSTVGVYAVVDLDGLKDYSTR